MKLIESAFQVLTLEQVVIIAIVSFILTLLLLKIQKKNESRRFFQKHLERNQSQFELKALMLYYFPIETFHFEDHRYKRGMYIEIITKYHHLKGTIVGINNNVLCIYNEGKITALHLTLIEKIKLLKT